MALAHATLVSLCGQAGSGHEPAHRFDRSSGYFWTATDGRVHSVPVTSDSSTRAYCGLEIDWLDGMAPALRESS